MVVGENCVAQVVLTFAAADIDAWIVHVNGRLSAREVDQILGHSGARRVIYTSIPASPETTAHGRRHGAEPAQQLGGLIDGRRQLRVAPVTAAVVQRRRVGRARGPAARNAADAVRQRCQHLPDVDIGVSAYPVHPARAGVFWSVVMVSLSEVPNVPIRPDPVKL